MAQKEYNLYSRFAIVSVNLQRKKRQKERQTWRNV